MTDLTAAERLDKVAADMVAEAFLADMHDDPDKGVRELQRLKADFTRRLNEFACEEIKRHLGSRCYTRQHAIMIAGIIWDEIGGEVCTKEWSQAAADRIVCALENNEVAGPEQNRST